MESEKYRRSVFLAVAAICIFFGPFLYGYYLGVDTARLPALGLGFTPGKEDHLSSNIRRTKVFHHLIPATATGINLCKLLLTAQLAGFGEPTILGWNHKGVLDGSRTHLFKITETAKYLRGLPPSAGEDLVFINDGYDIFFQLPIETLIARYYSTLKRHDDSLREQGILGQGAAETGAEIRSKLLFGADKWPGPALFAESYVWASPNSTLPDDVFGPKTDSGDIDYFRPRYLNSGTILGPVKELLEFFEATEDAILREAGLDQTLEKSDQYYFGQVWGPQEIGRQRLRDGDTAFEASVPDGAHVPDTKGLRTEYGVCLDERQEVFQLVSGWTPWLTFLKFDGKENPEVDGEMGENILAKNWTMPKDVLLSNPPYAAVDPDELPDSQAKAWSDVVLGANAINRQPYGLLHLTGNKGLREQWWPRLWFHPHGELLQKAARRRQVAREEPEVFMELDGIRWKQKQQIFEDHEKAGAWQSTGEYLSWQALCGRDKDQPELYQWNSAAR